MTWQRTTPLAPSQKPMKRTGFVKPRVPLHRSATMGEAQESPRLKNSIRPRGGIKTRQRSVSKGEKLLWQRLAQDVGCIACRLDGKPSGELVSIHHIDGRTKPGCHGLVLPLCAGHHQDGTGADASLIAVHPYKARFEARYGTQRELLARCLGMLGDVHG